MMAFAGAGLQVVMHEGLIRSSALDGSRDVLQAAPGPLALSTLALSINILQDAVTQALSGITGRFMIVIRDNRHFHEFDDCLPAWAQARGTPWRMNPTPCCNRTLSGSQRSLRRSRAQTLSGVEPACWRRARMPQPTRRLR